MCKLDEIPMSTHVVNEVLNIVRGDRNLTIFRTPIEGVDTYVVVSHLYRKTCIIRDRHSVIDGIYEFKDRFTKFVDKSPFYLNRNDDKSIHFTNEFLEMDIIEKSEFIF